MPASEPWPPPQTIFFWGRNHPGWEWLSNFFVHPVVLPHVITGEPFAYASGEHAFQCAKTVTMADFEWIASAATPAIAKRRGSPRGENGRRITLRQGWHRMRFEVMVRVLRAKFADAQLRQRLLATGDRYLAEDSKYDFDWGIRDRQGGYGGNNLLGKALMKVRAEIAAAELPSSP